MGGEKASPVHMNGPPDPGRELSEASSDEALLAAFSRGDAAAARALALRHGPRIHGYAARLLGDRHEAEDITQEVMLRLWKMAPRWRSGEARLSTWLYRVASNLCTDRLRRRAARAGPALQDVPEPPDEGPSALESLSEGERVAALNAALSELPERQRMAIVLRHLEGLSNPRIAQIMGVSVEAVESLVARGKRALAGKLAARKDELGYADEQ